jgi:hypothetical protein
MSPRDLLSVTKPVNLEAFRLTLAAKSDTDQYLVIGVGSNPEPIRRIPFKNSQGAIVISDAPDRDFTDFLETNRRIPQIPFSKPIIHSCHFQDSRRELGVRLPETRNRDRFRRAACFFLRRSRHRLPLTENPSARRLRLLRRGDPTPHYGAPAIDELARRTLIEKVGQPSLRSLPESSRRNDSVSGAARAKRFQWGRGLLAAEIRRFCFRHRRPNSFFNGAAERTSSFKAANR